MKKILSVLTLIALLFVTQVQAQRIDKHDYLGRLNCITTAVPFLTIAPDSRGGSMGDIGCATSADANSQAYNPSKYVFSKNKFGISVSYSPWLRKLVTDINLAYLSAYWKITDMDAIAFSMRYFSLGDIQFTDEMGQDMGSKKPNEFALDFTYSRKLIDELSIAITPRFICSDLASGAQAGGEEITAGLAGAADISLFYEQDFRVKGLENSTLRAGLNISNMGNKMSYSSGTLRRDFLPTNLKLGIGYEVDIDEYNAITLSADINKLLVPSNPVYKTDSMGRIVYDAANNPIIESGMNPDVSVPTGMIHSFYDAPGGFREELSELSLGIGLEYGYRNLFFVRAGYFYEHPDKGNRQFLTLGAGLKYNIFNIDVSYLFAVKQYHPLANTLRFTLSFDFVSFNKDAIKNQGKLR